MDRCSESDCRTRLEGSFTFSDFATGIDSTRATARAGSTAASASTMVGEISEPCRSAGPGEYAATGSSKTEAASRSYRPRSTHFAVPADPCRSRCAGRRGWGARRQLARKPPRPGRARSIRQATGSTRPGWRRVFETIVLDRHYRFRGSPGQRSCASGSAAASPSARNAQA